MEPVADAFFVDCRFAAFGIFVFNCFALSKLLRNERSNPLLRAMQDVLPSYLIATVLARVESASIANLKH